MGVAAMIMLYAGLRIGEVLALEWTDIDLEARTITVSKARRECSTNSIYTVQKRLWFRMEGVEKYFSKKLRKRKTLSEADLPLKASVLTV